MRAAARDAKLIDDHRADPRANALFLDVLTSPRDPEHFGLIEDLAAAFGNAAVGASRAVVDAGWRPHAEQVGQTGKTVKPDVYIACGISGAVQHLAGIAAAKTVVAINTDGQSPLGQAADYAVVGDLHAFLPLLLEQVRAANS